MRWLSISRMGLLFLSFQLIAAEKNKEVDELRAELKKNIPQLTIDEIKPSPLSGLYQVTSGPIILYASPNGRYVISGDIVDLKNKNQNITEEARKTARVTSINQIGKENMVIFAPKNPKYTITVFTDVDCGYCHKFQSEMTELNAKGIAVNYLAFPRTGPDTPTFDKMIKVWCSKDKGKAFIEASQGKDIEGQICADNPILKELQLGLQFGVNGTPTIIFEDGTLFPGYLPPDKLLEVLQKSKS